MDTITASLQRSMQNCSLNGGGGGEVAAKASPADNPPAADAYLELDSSVSLPCQWEECLDLKTGEVYYVNWRTGAKSKDDPGKSPDYFSDGYSSDGSEDSSVASSPSSREDYRGREDEVLVVAGCKSCLMYFMLPKTVQLCPKCNDLLLHFDQAENGY